MKRKDYRSLNSALLQQGWTLESTNNGHTKAIPPDREQQIVLFSPSNDPRAFKNTIHRLQRSGFRGFMLPDSGEVNVDKEVAANVPKEKREAEMTQEQVVDAANDVNPDQLFRDLKEARTYAALAKEALAETRQKFDEAQRALRGSEEEYERAIDHMNQCKKRFDKAFQEDGL
jgi:hypothetical protein